MKLIDKDVLVAEIERRISQLESEYKKLANLEIWITAKEIEHKINGLKEALSIVSTLEVKEVDLDKYYYEFLQKEWFGKNCNRTMSEMMAFTARHFFELGLKAQKGE